MCIFWAQLLYIHIYIYSSPPVKFMGFFETLEDRAGAVEAHFHWCFFLITRFFFVVQHFSLWKILPAPPWNRIHHFFDDGIPEAEKGKGGVVHLYLKPIRWIFFPTKKNGENDEHDSLPWKTTTTNSNNETNIFIACKQRPSKYGDKTHEEPRLLQESPEDEGFLAILQARRPQACGVFQGFRGWLVGRNGILKGGDLYTHHYLGFLLKWCR